MVHLVSTSSPTACCNSWRYFFPSALQCSGSILGPVLFLLYVMINDLPDAVTNSTVPYFADDTKIFRSIDSITDTTVYYSKTTWEYNLKSWSNSSGLLFNDHLTKKNAKVLVSPDVFNQSTILTASKAKNCQQQKRSWEFGFRATWPCLNTF